MSIILTFPTNSNGQTFDVDTIVYNGDPHKFINLVFLGDGYTESELSQYVLDVANVSDYIFSTSPFLEYQNYFNVFAISVPSAQSGTDHPGTATDVSEPVFPVESVNTYFNGTFDAGSIHRLLVAGNSSAINSVLFQNFPLYDQALILINSPYYGGSGGSRAVSSLHSSAPEIMLHEMGHSFGGLADEYYAGDQYANERPNMTQETNPNQVKWQNWMGDLGIGIYQHCCGGNSAEWYRPHQGCKMRALGTSYPFCAVCTETMIERIHSLFGIPVASYEPSENSISMCGSPVEFSLNTVAPIPNTLSNVWKLNGNEIEFDTDVITITGAQLNPGNNTLLMEITDDTELTRANSHPANHTYTISWVINYEPLTEPVITSDGETMFCEGGSVTLTCSPAEEYLWSNGEDTESITVAESGNYTVTISNSYGCTATSEVVVVVVEPIPEAYILEGVYLNACPGDAVTLTAGPADIYFWSTGESTQSITVFEEGEYVVTVENSLGCIAISEATTVDYFTTADATIVPGDTSICEGDTITLTTGNGSGYLWSTGATSQQITVADAGTYIVTVTSVSGCSASSEPVAITISPIPLAEIMASGETSFCNGDSVTLSASDADFYLWSNGANSQSISVNSGGTYAVTVTSAEGCSAVADEVDVTVHTPEPTVTLSGSTNACQGDTVMLMSTEALTYLWSTGDTVQLIFVAEDGAYAVTVTDSTGCIGVSELIEITFHELPDATIAIHDTTAICAGDSVVLIAEPGFSYAWNTGDTTRTIVTYSDGVYQVVLSSVFGCQAVSDMVVINVFDLPETPTITEQDGSLTSSAPAGNQWYLNGTPITGATGQAYIPAISGTYYVVVTDSNGCTAISDTLHVTVVSVENPGAEQILVVIPNPNSGKFRLRTSGTIVGEVLIHDLTGKIVFRTTDIQSEIDISGLPKSIYFVSAEINGHIYRNKIIVQ